MAKRWILLSLGCCLWIACAGCCGCWRGPLFGPRCMMDGGCGPACGSCGGCGDECGPFYGPARRPIRDRGYVVPGGDCGPACADGGPTCGPTCGPEVCPSCGGGMCGPCFCFRPLRWVVNLFRAPFWCGPNCGPAYWGEFRSDPPDCWDPCDDYGNFTGRGCASCNHASGYNGGVPAPATDPLAVPDADDTPTVKPAPAPQPHKASQTGYRYYH